MKDYEEMAKNVFKRIDEYEAEKKGRKERERKPALKKGNRSVTEEYKIKAEGYSEKKYIASAAAVILIVGIAGAAGLMKMQQNNEGSRYLSVSEEQMAVQSTTENSSDENNMVTEKSYITEAADITEISKHTEAARSVTSVPGITEITVSQEISKPFEDGNNNVTVTSESVSEPVRSYCYTGAPVTDRSEVVLIDIVNIAERDHIGTDECEEVFFKDNKYTYIFPSIESDYIECTFSDGSKMKIKEALKKGAVSVIDLDKYGILYYAESVNTEDSANGNMELCWKVNGAYYDSEPVCISAEDSRSIKEIIDSCKWYIGTADCYNDFVFIRADGTEIYYHSDCGTFNDNSLDRSYKLLDEQKAYINEYLKNIFGTIYY